MDTAVVRDDMVDGIEQRAPLEEAVSQAMRTVPRHEFVEDRPYDNRASEFEGTRVLAPGLAGRLVSALSVDPDDSVLVVGVGVGYTAALLAELVGDRQVHAVDIVRPVVYESRRNLERAGYDGVLVDCRDGAGGLPEYAPYDRILVEAGAVRPPKRLLRQLTSEGRLVMPLGGGGREQTLVAVENDDSEGAVVDEFGPVRFRPLLVDGEQRSSPRNRTDREDAEFAKQGYFAPTGWEQEWIDWDEHL
ncbi:protein-L-isoaspartate O-methyltransferase family protein [Salinigranum halophilum]|jgi:protein-L-isoaspartate(D-aspartate) O-methyltransferase|uniref:protein-L-isoaspartate O-methyltransferase family protein n=1 Tax=Salinigranum halophilum TaxID=2565931 RepID=UPI0010A834FD|nr:protein-L-isoaspartate O-methyltransferase [Salinigranum halophilum]